MAGRENPDRAAITRRSLFAAGSLAALAALTLPGCEESGDVVKVKTETGLGVSAKLVFARVAENGPALKGIELTFSGTGDYVVDVISGSNGGLTSIQKSPIHVPETPYSTTIVPPGTLRPGSFSLYIARVTREGQLVTGVLDSQ